MGLFSTKPEEPEDDELRKALSNGAFLVDVRTPGEFAGGTVRGAVNIPLDVVASRLEDFEGKDDIVVFCQSGGRSGRAKGILEQNGFKNVINGGGWKILSYIVDEFH